MNAICLFWCSSCAPSTLQYHSIIASRRLVWSTRCDSFFGDGIRSSRAHIGRPFEISRKPDARLSHNPAALPIAGATVPPGRTEQHSAGAAMAGSGGGAPTLAVKARRLWLRAGAGGELRVAPRQFRQLRPPPLAVFAIGQDAELVGIIAIMRRPFRGRPRIGPAMRASALPR